ncbi:MAG: heavy-metal-associated domain-containing protein [Phycisphaerales bacterium]|nr:MAG: heavy-metal-associated domain-containing protein [Phycisphaerales bacterium]
MPAPTRLRVKGMSCDGCARAVTRAVMSVEGVERAEVSLGEGWASYEGSAEPEAVADAIEDVGFEAIPPGDELGDELGDKPGN